MGQRKARKAKFLAAHPICCFCGGSRPSAEPDHVPSRAIFQGRRWPEGFEFPACVSCNRSTRDDEQIVAMLSRLYPEPQSLEEQAEVHECMRAVAHNFPNVLREMQPSYRQLRQTARKYGIEKPHGGTFMDIPALSVNGPLVNTAVVNFGRKLFCALYYKHAGKILPQGGGIGIRWYTNLQINADEIPDSLAAVMPDFPKLERARKDLSSQFFYRSGVSECKEAAVFLALFRQSFAIVGYVRCNKEDMPTSSLVTIVEPISEK